MTGTEIIYAIREKLKSYTDDSRYSDSYLMFLINTKRAFYIRREYNQLQRTFDSEVLQSVCMQLEEVDASVCPECKELTTNECVVIRTVKKFPKTIELHSRSSMVKISSVGVFDKNFNIVSLAKIPYAGESKYEAKYIFATLHPNGYIYLKSTEDSFRSLEYINVIGLFENPDSVSEYDCGGSPCYDFDSDGYPIGSWMVDFVIEDIVKQLANLKALPEDLSNDAKDITNE